jgi:hypothetical protein
MPKATQSFAMKHLVFEMKSTPHFGSLGKWTQQNALAADPKESECVYACQCGTEMPMFIGIRDRTEMPRQVLQAMEAHTRKHQ